MSNWIISALPFSSYPEPDSKSFLCDWLRSFGAAISNWRLVARLTKSPEKWWMMVDVLKVAIKIQWYNFAKAKHYSSKIETVRLFRHLRHLS